MAKEEYKVNAKSATEVKKIGLIDVDGHETERMRSKTVYPNLALCKIAAYHISIGDDVEWAVPYCHYDILYMPKVFPPWQSDMARWCNKKMLFTAMPFEDYSPRKGFKCKTYIEQLNN